MYFLRGATLKSLLKTLKNNFLFNTNFITVISFSINVFLAYICNYHSEKDCKKLVHKKRVFKQAAPSPPNTKNVCSILYS